MSSGRATAVHAVLPDDIDNPATPSGGNSYDRRVCDGLAALGHPVVEYPVPGGWPHPDAAARNRLAAVLASLPDAAVVLVDGLIAATVPEVLHPAADRLRLVVLVHLPFGDEAERAALACATAIVATSDWTRRYLLDRYALPADRVHAAPPGVDPAAVVAGSRAGGRLLCVAAVTPQKGHDVLLAALATLADLPWTCTCVGSLARDPTFVAALPATPRVTFTGPRTNTHLDAAWASADLLVLPSRGETYGMVVTEALARGIPVLGTDARGLPEALGRAPDGALPGLLVPPGDPSALAAALRRWLSDPQLREELRRRALDRRRTLTGWPDTVARMSTILNGVRA